MFRMPQPWTREPETVNAALFEDPLALRTQWTPMRVGGASFGTHRIVELDSTHLELRKTPASFLFGALFLVVGLGLAGVGALMGSWLHLLFGIPFTLAGAYAAWPTALRFDGQTRQFPSANGPVPFSTIHAAQLIREYCRSNKRRGYWGYELNLVLHDGQRLHVVDHGDLPSLRADSKKITALIGCKLWDAAG